MVGRLVWLKWRLLANGLRADRQRAVGFPVVALFVVAIGLWLADLYRSAGAELTPDAVAEYSLWVMLVAWLAWAVLPVMLFPLDETLDPARFALAPMGRLQLMTGLGAAGALTPTIAIPVLLLAANLTLFPGPAAAAVAVVAGALLLVHLVVAGQTFTTLVSNMLRGRRGRDLAVVVVSTLGIGGYISQRLIARTVGELGIGGAVLAHPLSEVAWLLPPVATQHAVVAAAAGRWGMVAAALAASAAWLVAIVWMWSRLLQRLLTTPAPSPLPAKARRRRDLNARKGWSPTAVVARKELRFYLRDPRQRMVWTGAVIFLGVVVASVILGETRLEVLRESAWLPLLGPLAVLFIGLPVALNQLGWERNAASFLFALPVRTRHLLTGKNLATGAALFVEASLLSVFLAAVSGGWEQLPLVPPLTLAAIGCQLAVGNLVSVLTPLRLPDAGTDLFAQATEQGCLALVAQLLSFFVIALLMVPPASAFVLAVGFGQVLSPLAVSLAAVLWGGALYGLGLWASSAILHRRVPELVARVQTV